jgi:hypothetical protein
MEDSEIEDPDLRASAYELRTIREIVRTAEAVVWHGLERAIGWSVCIALRVIQRDRGDFPTAPDNQGSDRCEDDTDEEKSRQHCFWSENRLPSFQTLLLESGIYGSEDIP